MKWSVSLCAAFIVALGIVPARGTTLPDSCGDDKVQFDVATRNHQPIPSAPQAGDALVFFVERFDQNMGLCLGCKVTTRVGIDGKWQGANNGNSYFAVNVAPGQHHVCVDWQSALARFRQKVALTSFTAEAGKVYYYQIDVEVKQYATGEATLAVDRTLRLTPLDEDNGKYLVKISRLSTSSPKS